MNIISILGSIILGCSIKIAIANDTQLGAPVPIYTESQLIKLANENKHLEQIELDNCQIVEDIIVRATRINLPSYEFLYGDMLAWGVCVEQNVNLGLHYIQSAANQGLPAALAQLGNYYSHGTLVQQDQEKAILFLREAAALGSLTASISLAELLLLDYGSPLDYADAYKWLHSLITADSKKHEHIALLQDSLAERMPENIIAKVKKELYL